MLVISYFMLTGITKASVFPDPVLAAPRMFDPCRESGRDSF